MPGEEAQAEAELACFARAERSLFREPADICKSYKDHAIHASTIRALKDTPIDNIMTKRETKTYFDNRRLAERAGPAESPTI